MSVSFVDPTRINSRLSADQIAKLANSNRPRVAENGAIFSGAVRLSFPNLDSPYKGKMSEKEKFQLSGLWPHNAVKTLEDVLRTALQREYPNLTDPSIFMDRRSDKATIKDQGLCVNVKDGGYSPLKSTYGGYVPGFPWFRAKSGFAVPCFQFVAGKPTIVLPENIPEVFYSGCWVDVKLNLIKSTSSANPGVFFGLQGVVKLADDNTLGGGSSASASDFAGAVVIEDPNAGAAEGWD